MFPPFYIVAAGGLERVNLAYDAATKPDMRNLCLMRGPQEASEIADSDKILEMFIQAGVDVSGSVGNGVTALHLAAVQGRETTIELLLNAGSDVSLKTSGGDTALMLACAMGHHDSCGLLDKRLDFPCATAARRAPIVFDADAYYQERDRLDRIVSCVSYASFLSSSPFSLGYDVGKSSPHVYKIPYLPTQQRLTSLMNLE